MKRNYQIIGGMAALCSVAVIAGKQVVPQQNKPLAARPAVTRVKARNPIAATIVAAARKQIGTAYDPAYVKLAYPGGDVPADRGVCTDVIVRALRRTNHDLQRLIHEDMRSHFFIYPKNWGLKRPDPNIDHRRVPNQMRFFERYGLVLTKEASPRTARQWQAGDIVCWRFANGLYHTGIVSDRLNEQGLPFVIHNLGQCVEDNSLRRWKIIGHYRYPVAVH